MLSCRCEDLHYVQVRRKYQASKASGAQFCWHKALREILQFKSFKCIESSDPIPRSYPWEGYMSLDWTAFFS